MPYTRHTNYEHLLSSTPKSTTSSSISFKRKNRFSRMPSTEDFEAPLKPKSLLKCRSFTLLNEEDSVPNPKPKLAWSPIPSPSLIQDAEDSFFPVRKDSLWNPATEEEESLKSQNEVGPNDDGSDKADCPFELGEEKQTEAQTDSTHSKLSRIKENSFINLLANIETKMATAKITSSQSLEEKHYEELIQDYPTPNKTVAVSESMRSARLSAGSKRSLRSLNSQSSLDHETPERNKYIPKYTGYKPQNGVCFISFKNMFKKPAEDPSITQSFDETSSEKSSDLEEVESAFNEPVRSNCKPMSYSQMAEGISLENTIQQLNKREREIVDNTRKELREQIEFASESKKTKKKFHNKKIHLNIFVRPKQDFDGSGYADNLLEKTPELHKHSTSLEDNYDTIERLKHSISNKNDLFKQRQKREAAKSKLKKEKSIVEHDKPFLKKNTFVKKPVLKMENLKQTVRNLSHDTDKYSSITDSPSRTRINSAKKEASDQEGLKNICKKSTNFSKSKKCKDQDVQTLVSMNSCEESSNIEDAPEYSMFEQIKSISSDYEEDNSYKAEESSHAEAPEERDIFVGDVKTITRTVQELNPPEEDFLQTMIKEIEHIKTPRKDPNIKKACVETKIETAESLDQIPKNGFFFYNSNFAYKTRMMEERKKVFERALSQPKDFKEHFLEKNQTTDKSTQMLRKVVEESNELYRRLHFCGINVSKETVARALMSPSQYKIYEQSLAQN